MQWADRLVHAHQRLAIRHRVMGAIAVVLLGLAIVDGWAAYGETSRAMLERRDRALARIAASCLRALSTQDADLLKIPANVFREELGGAQPPRLRFSVNGARGEFIAGDGSLPPPPPSHREAAALQPEFRDEVVAGERLRVAVVSDFLLVRANVQAVTVQVAEAVEERTQEARSALLGILGMHSLRLIVLMTVISVIVRLGLRPLETLGEELRRRKPKDQDLSPFDEARPAELAPVVATLNRLLTEQQESIDQQRKFLADASHQLRTPIAVLRTLVQGALINPPDTAESLRKMLGIIDRATGLTDQLLSMAKAEQLIRRRNWQRVRLDEVARDIAVEFAPLIARKRLDFSLQATPVAFDSDAWLLGEFIKNLVSNAIHHSRHGGALGIVVRELQNNTEMIVWDHGGGVAEDVMERLFEPFNTSKGGTGIGLGLSICRQIAESMNASIDLFNRIEAGEIIGVDAVVRWGRLSDAGAPGSQEPHLG